MRGIGTAFMAALCLLLAACQFHATTGQANEQLNAEAATNYADVAAGLDAAVVARMSSANDSTQIRAQIPMMRQLIGDGTAGEPTVIQTRTSVTNQGRFYEVVQTYPYPDRIARVTTVFISENGVWKIQSFNMNVTALPGAEPMPAPATPAPVKAPGGIQT